MLQRGGAGSPKGTKILITWRSCWGHVGIIFRSWAQFSVLGRFFFACLRFFAPTWPSELDFSRPDRDFEASGTNFGGHAALFFDVFSCTRARNAKTAREAFRIGKTNTRRMLAIARAAQKTGKNRPSSLLKRTSGQCRLQARKNSVLEGPQPRF